MAVARTFRAALAALALSVLVQAVAAQGATSPDDPAQVVHGAVQAVERGATPRLVATWKARLAQDSSNRAALLGLATIARLTYDYASSDQLYRRLFARDSVAPDSYSAWARVGYGDSQYLRGKSADASLQFARARALAKRLNDRAAEARAILSSAITFGNAHGAPAAAQLMDTATALLSSSARRAALLPMNAEVLWKRALFLAVESNPTALPTADSAMAAARVAGEVGLEALGLRARGLYFEGEAQYDSAAAIFARSAALSLGVHDLASASYELMRRAGILRGWGQLGEFKRLIEQARVEAQAAQSEVVLAASYMGLGAMELQLNDVGAAEGYLRTALSRSQAAGDSGNIVLARYFTALARSATGDTATANALLRDNVAYYDRINDPGEYLQTETGLAFIAMRSHAWLEAARVLAAAHDYASRKLPPWLTVLRYDEGRLALFVGDLPRAGRLLDGYLKRLDTTDHLGRYTVRIQRAAVYAGRGDLSGAEREATEAEDQLDRWRATLVERQFRVFAFQTAITDLNDLDVSVARVIDALAIGGRARSAFALAERERARELADQLVRGAALRVDAGADSSSRRYTALSSDEVMRAIPDDRTAILEYVVGEYGAPTTVFVLTRSMLSARQLTPIDSLAPSIGTLNALLETGADPRPLARRLGASILDPVLASLPAGITRLVVVPDGELHRVPFAALRMADGRFVVERFAIGEAPSASVLVSLWRTAPRATPASSLRLLAFGDPAFANVKTDTIQADSAYWSAFASSGGLPRLRASGAEARLVAGYAGKGEVRLGPKASAAYLRHAALGEFDVIHLATHALVDNRSIARTALALAPTNNESGFIGPGDLAALRLNAQLVVLSACRTAAGMLVRGEGVEGLTAPLLAAGARTVVASRWRIDDESTVHFVQAFYAALADHLPASDALRAAMLSSVRQGAPANQWAAFSMVGDPFTRVAVHTPPSDNSHVRAVLTAIVFLILMAVLLYWIRTRMPRATERSSEPGVRARTHHL